MKAIVYQESYSRFFGLKRYHILQVYINGEIAIDNTEDGTLTPNEEYRTVITSGYDYELKDETIRNWIENKLIRIKEKIRVRRLKCAGWLVFDKGPTELEVKELKKYVNKTKE
ncbi:MAG: hypothetical protein ACTSP4_00860 [Candidatus Hodarchaeales archaeon]